MGKYLTWQIVFWIVIGTPLWMLRCSPLNKWCVFFQMHTTHVRGAANFKRRHLNIGWKRKGAKSWEKSGKLIYATRQQPGWRGAKYATGVSDVLNHWMRENWFEFQDRVWAQFQNLIVLMKFLKNVLASTLCFLYAFLGSTWNSRNCRACL